MKSLRYFSKSIFWSPLLLGMVAILVLPNWLQSELNSVVNDQEIVRNDIVFSDYSPLELPYFVQFDIFFLVEILQQAVQNAQFIVKTYCLYCIETPPIRAGPNGLSFS